MKFLILSSAAMRRVVALLFILLVAGCGSPEDRAQNYYERGMKLLSQQDYVKASIEFKNALQLKKNLVGAWRGLAQIEEHNKNWPGLVALLRTVTELDAKDVRSRLRLGRLLLAGNELDQALDIANAADAIDGGNADVFALRAAILLQLNDGAGAKREAQAAVEIDSTNAGAHLVLAAERLTRGDAEGALAILERQAAVFENDLGVQLFKASLYQKVGNFEKLEGLLRKLTDLNPQEAVFRRLLVTFYADQKRSADAEKALRAWVAANSESVEIGLELVRFIQQLRGPVAAREELVNLINAGVQGFRYQIALAEFDFAQGDVAQSTQLLEKLSSAAGLKEQAVIAQLKLAEIYLSSKNIDAAEPVVADVLRKDSRNTSGLKLRALIRMERRQLDTAIADIRQALNDQPRSTELMLLLATAYDRSGSIELAEKQYADATTVSGFDPAVGLRYVAFLRRRSSIERAEDILTELASRSPNNLAVLTNLAEVRLARQNWIGAQEIAERIKQVGDSRGMADQILGAALSGRGRYDESIKILENAYAAAPGAVQPMAALVNTLIRAQKMDRAIEFLQTVLVSNPANAEAHVLLGSIQLLRNEPDLALQTFQRAIEQQPKNLASYQALVDFYLRQRNNTDEALKVARAALQQVPEHFGMRLTLAYVLQEKRDYEAAIAEYEHLLKQQPASLVVANNLASLLSDHRTDKASLDQAYALAASLRKSGMPAFKDTLGWVYYQRGEYRNAVALLEEAAAALPNLPLVRYHLGVTYVATNQLAKASEQFKKALELAQDDDLKKKILLAQEKAAI